MQRIASRLTLPVLISLSLAAQYPSICTAEETPTRLDSRADRTGLLADTPPWCPNRYGADDQLGALNEITPKVARKLWIRQQLVAGSRCGVVTTSAHFTDCANG